MATKREVGRQLDALIVKTVPDVRKAVKWNSPFYGIEGQGWFLSFHCFTRYVKVAFFRGTSLKPLPPGESKDPNTRYLDIYEADEMTRRWWGTGYDRQRNCRGGCRNAKGAADKSAEKKKALDCCLRAFSVRFPANLVGGTGIEPVTPAV